MEGGAFSHYAYDGENPGRHLSKLLPVDGEMVMLQIPANVNKSATRSKLDMYMRCLWSSLDHEVKDDQTILDMLNGIGGSNVKSVLDIPDYKCHPKTLEALQNGRPPPIPLALYLDGVAYVNQAAGRSETILGWWLINLLTGVRHFMRDEKWRHVLLWMSKLVLVASCDDAHNVDAGSHPRRTRADAVA